MRSPRKGTGFLLAALLWAWPLQAESPCAPIDTQLKGKIKSSLDRALRLTWQQQGPDGSWRDDAGLTGLILKAFIESPRRYSEADGPYTRNAARLLFNSARASGALTGGAKPFNATAQALLGLESTRNPAYGELVESARRFLQEQKAEDLAPPRLAGLGFALVALPEGLSWPAVDRWVKGGETGELRLPVEEGSEAVATAIRLLATLQSDRPDLETTEPLLETARQEHQRLQEGNRRLHFHFAYFLAEGLHRYHKKVAPAGDWCGSLLEQILAGQTPEGSWQNPVAGWGEEDPIRATALAVLTVERLSNP